LAQDRALELLEVVTRVDPELLDEGSTGVLIRSERLRLPTRPVERENELPSQALPIRVRGDQGLQP
jgi:hypothetical protein